MSKNKNNKSLLQKAFYILVLLLAWEAVFRMQVFSPSVFPSLFSIGRAFAQGVENGVLVDKTLYSLSLIFKGLFISLPAAVVFSSLATRYQMVENILDASNSLLHPLPGIALLPVAILWFGIGEGSIVFIIIHSVLWPMLVNFKAGFQNIPRIYLEVGRNLGLNGPGLLWGVMLPASLPYFLSGLKIAWARAWRAAIAAEMVFGAASGTAGGLGWHIYMTRYLFDISGTFAALMSIVIIGLIVEELFFKGVEKATVVKWGMTV